MGSPVWRWGDVEASAGEDHRATLLRHVAGGHLRVRRGRLIPDADYRRSPPVVRQQLARVGALLRLREHGRYLIHASGVVDPRGEGLLFAGDSGAGKSTLAYALARCGWSALGDDGVVVEVQSDRCVAHGWRAPMRVSTRLTPHFPELATSAGPGVTADLRDRICVPVSPARRAPVRAIVLVSRGTQLRLTRASPTAALAALIRQSPWVAVADAYAAKHLAALHWIAQHVTVLTMVNSEEALHRLPDALTEAL